MRLRICVLACVLATLGSLGASGAASAAPRPNRQLSIAAVPNPILAGEGVLIYGRLSGPDGANQTIRLYHHLDGSGLGYTLVGTTSTNSLGEYEFTRAENIVMTNRDWFARGPGASHSRTLHERVAALITLSASSTTVDTAHPLTFTGHVTPDHAFQRAFLQKQDLNSDGWSTVASTFIGPDSNYVIIHRFRVPGAYGFRVVLRGDARNIRSASDTADVIVEQAQVHDFTISSSAPTVSEGGSTNISGVLYQPGTTIPEPDTVVQLWGRHADQPFVVLADVTTSSDGSYSFSQTGLTANTVYYATTMKLPHVKRRRTARLFEGVTDVLTMQASANSTPTNQSVTFTGTVLPDKAGHLIYLQRLDRDGQFHTVTIGLVRGDSTFQFNWQIGSPGTYTFRARIVGDGENLGATSPPVNVTATSPSTSALPASS